MTEHANPIDISTSTAAGVVPGKLGVTSSSTSGIQVSCSANNTMRWNSHDHDGRLNDLVAVLVLLILIIAAWHYFGTRSEPASHAAFIVPSQSVRW